MESLRRKRKGIRTNLSTNSSSVAGSHLSDDAARRSKRKCGDKSGSRCGRAVFMTVPPCAHLGAAASSPGRGLKRKVGCIESATRLGRQQRLELEYVMGRNLGHGRYGSVRACRKRSGSGEELACKTLPKSVSGDGSAHREVEIMQHISGHPGVVTLEAVFEDMDCFHLVMELCPGGRLLDVMVEEGQFSEHRAASVLKQVVSVIKYCHEMGVVHRDIKPENILLTASGTLKLSDFGLAMRVTNGQKLSGIAGSPAYVAPEVLEGEYSEKVDIWGAGVLLHALLIGALPFQGDSLDEIFEAIKNVDLDFNSGPWESISEIARDLISRMLTRDVSLRMSAEEVLRHSWVLFYTETTLPKSSPITCKEMSCRTELEVQLEQSVKVNLFSSPGTSSQIDEHDTGLVDALAAAISRVRISEPKRTKICSPGRVEQQDCASSIKTNLCTAF